MKTSNKTSTEACMQKYPLWHACWCKHQILSLSMSPSVQFLCVLYSVNLSVIYPIPATLPPLLCCHPVLARCLVWQIFLELSHCQIKPTGKVPHYSNIILVYMRVGIGWKYYHAYPQSVVDKSLQSMVKSKLSFERHP